MPQPTLKTFDDLLAQMEQCAGCVIRKRPPDDDGLSRRGPLFFLSLEYCSVFHHALNASYS
jgi:hypothetical protein